MDWLADILKNLAVSRTLVVAIFVTAAVMYFGPTVAPGQVPKLKEDFIPYLFAAMFLSGMLLVIWTLNALWVATHQAARRTARNISSQAPFSEAEVTILFVMSQNPTNPLCLDHIDYSQTPITKLGFHQLTKALERKGLVSINPYDENLVSLTELGRERALEIQKKVKRNGAA